MKLALSGMISEIDAYCESTLGISIVTLMQKAGSVIADVVRTRVEKGKRVVILAGKGNNGGDGYAAATMLMNEYKVKVYDIFSAGQKSDAGRYFLNKYLECGGEVVNYACTKEIIDDICTSCCIVDAIFGTGFKGEMPEELRILSVKVREAVGVYKIAVDVPLGVNPDDGSISNYAMAVSATISLSYIKPGIISYPARSLVGEIVYSDLGLPEEKIEKVFKFRHFMTDEDIAVSILPHRPDNSNKGTFGKLLCIAGSERYRGAAHLSLEAALRTGVGRVTFLGTKSLIDELSIKYPEAVYIPLAVDDELKDEDIERIVALSAEHSATLVGPGSDCTDGLLRLTRALLSSAGTPLILDADAINVLAGMADEGVSLLKHSEREIVLTPHPLEFARLSLSDVATVQQHRLEVAERFAAENKVTLILKGAGTIITDGKDVYINTSGSSALAKAGSGDVLAGAVASIVAEGGDTLVRLSALAAYLHACAGRTLATEYSSFGVTPSDLPQQIAREICYIEREKMNIK